MTRGLLSYLRQNHLALLCLFLILGGGSAWAVNGPLAGKNTVGSADIIDDEVKPGDVANPQSVGLENPHSYDGDLCYENPGMICSTNVNSRWSEPQNSYGLPIYFIDNEGWLHLQGHLQDIQAATQTMFTLPLRFRPWNLPHQNTLEFPTITTNQGAQRLQVLVDFNDHLLKVLYIGPNNPGVVSINGVSWRTKILN